MFKIELLQTPLKKKFKAYAWDILWVEIKMKKARLKVVSTALIS